MYYIRHKQDNTFVIAAKVTNRIAERIAFSCDGKWRTFNGKRAYEFSDSCVFGNEETMMIYLWAGSIMVEA